MLGQKKTMNAGDTSEAFSDDPEILQQIGFSSFIAALYSGIAFINKSGFDGKNMCSICISLIQVRLLSCLFIYHMELEN